MTTGHQDAERNAKALLKFALSNHNSKRYLEAAGYYEVILKQYPDTEVAQYAKINLSSLVNKIDGLESICVELSIPLPTASKPPQDVIASASIIQHRIHFKWKQIHITVNPYLLTGLVFLTALTGYFVGREIESNAKKSNAEQSMKAAFNKSLVDPGSVQFRELKVFLDVPTSKIRTTGSYSPTDVICGEFNSKNRMGGYTGFRYFYWDSDKNEIFGIIEDSTLGPIMQDLAKRTCDSI